MKISSIGYFIFFGSVLLAVMTKIILIGLFGFAAGFVLVIAGEFREGNKNAIIKSAIIILAISLAAILKG